MGSNSSIEWTGGTWTPIRARRRDTGKTGWHCEKVSPGCMKCYSETFNERNLPNGGTGLSYTVPSRDLVEIFLDEKILQWPFQWKKPKKIFVCSMTDLFADFVPYEIICKVFGVMLDTPRHIYQVLTKRIGRAHELLSDAGFANDVAYSSNWDSPTIPWPLPNVWMGTSCENQDAADSRIPALLQTPAAIRFVSYEPALGPIDFTEIHPDGLELPGPECVPVNIDALREQSDAHYFQPPAVIDWIIYGAESGTGARPNNEDWARSVRDQCAATDTAFFYKQNAKNGRKIPTPELDGRKWIQFPGGQR